MFGLIDVAVLFVDSFILLWQVVFAVVAEENPASNRNVTIKGRSIF